MIEENPADACLTREALLESGFAGDIVIVDSQQHAKNLLVSEPFDLLLSDFGTDFLTAQAFIASVRAAIPTLPIVVLSGIVDPSPTYAAGVNAFVRSKR